MAKPTPIQTDVSDALRADLLAASYTSVEMRKDEIADVRISGLDLSRQVLFICAAYDPANEPNFINGLSAISRRHGYDGMGTARDGYHRVMVGS